MHQWRSMHVHGSKFFRPQFRLAGWCAKTRGTINFGQMTYRRWILAWKEHSATEPGFHWEVLMVLCKTFSRDVEIHGLLDEEGGLDGLICFLCCLSMAAMGHPDKLRWVVRLLLTCPLPMHPGVGHLKTVSWCKAKTETTFFSHLGHYYSMVK